MHGTPYKIYDKEFCPDYFLIGNRVRGYRANVVNIPPEGENRGATYLIYEL